MPEGNGTTIDNFELQSWLDLTLTDGQDNPIWVSFDFVPDVEGEAATQENAPATLTLYTHSGLDSGTEYFYRIRTVSDNADNGGDAESVWSNDPNEGTTGAASATTTTGAPGLPTAVAAAAPPTPATDRRQTDAQIVGAITLTWTAPVSDGGSDLTGYEIQIWNASTRTWVPEDTVGDDELTYTDEGLEPGKGYYYILRAVNGVGPGLWTEFVTAAAGVGLPDAPVLIATHRQQKLHRSHLDRSGRQGYTYRRLRNPAMDPSSK